MKHRDDVRQPDSESRPPAGQERLWQSLRAVEPPAGARERVMRALEREEINPAPAPASGRDVAIRLARVAVPVAVVCAIAVAAWRLGADDHGAGVRASVVSANGARYLGDGGGADAGAVARGDAVRPGSFEVSPAGHLSLQLSAARVDVVGPGAVEVPDGNDRGLVLRAGAMTVDGQLAVQGPGCTADIDGKTEVKIRDGRVELRVFAGSAHIAAPEMACDVIDLTPLQASLQASERPGRGEARRDRGESGEAASGEAEPEEAGAASPAANEIAEATAEHDEQAARAPGEAISPPSGPARLAVRVPDTRRSPTRAGSATPPARSEPATAPTPADGLDSALSEQVEAYWAAVAKRDAAPAEALAELRAIARRWPRGAIRPEVELAIYDTLRQLGRDGDARAQARLILARYPDTPRADALRRHVRNTDSNGE